MMNKDYLVAKDYELTCLSPVHIGSGEVLKAFEYLYERKSGEVYFLDGAKWLRFLAEKGLTDKLLEYVSYGWHKENLWEWLTRNGATAEELRSLAQRHGRTLAELESADKQGRKSLNDIHRGTALADGRLYIPGSSIKGVLRTALLARLLKREPELVRRVATELAANVERHNKKRSDYDRLTGRLEAALIQKLVLVDKNGKRLNGMIADCLRGLLVSDAIPVGDPGTVILQKYDLTTGTRKHPGCSTHGISLFRECLPAGAKLRLRISLDKHMLGGLGIVDPSELLRLAGELLQEGLSLQQKAFTQAESGLFAEAENADFMLGGGTGFISKTLWYQLFADKSEAMQLLKEYLDDNFRKPSHEHRLNDRLTAPRTLHVTAERGRRQLLGLCRMEELSC